MIGSKIISAGEPEDTDTGTTVTTVLSIQGDLTMDDFIVLHASTRQGQLEAPSQLTRLDQLLHDHDYTPANAIEAQKEERGR